MKKVDIEFFILIIVFRRVISFIYQKFNVSDRVPLRTPKPRGRHLSGPRRTFWGPLAAILDFAGGVALQTVSETLPVTMKSYPFTSIDST